MEPSKQRMPPELVQQAYRTAYLIAGYVRKSLTVSEHDELDDWINESDSHMKLFEELTDKEHLAANMEWMDKVLNKRENKK